MRIVPVDGSAYAGQAARLLTAAWGHASALEYSAAYLDWQFRFPAPESNAPLAVAAESDGECIGFCGATPRRVRLGGQTRFVPAVSFVAVHPDWSGKGISAALYEELLGRLTDRGSAVLTYGQPGTAGNHLIEKAYPANGYQLHSIGEYSVYGCMPRPGVGAEWKVAQAAGLPEQIDEEAGNWAWSDPNEAQMAHYALDPRPRRWIAVEREGRRAAGWAVDVSVRSPQGNLSVVPSLESVWCGKEDAEALAALAREVGSRMVTAPNLLYWKEALQRIGFRQTPAVFRGYWATPRGYEAKATPTGTNLEII